MEQKEHYKNIPEELKKLPRWCNFKLQQRGERWTKIPYQPQTGQMAKANEVATWSPYEEVVQGLETGLYHGIGFFLAPPYFGVDIDHLEELPQGVLEEFVETLGTYWEYSPSGKGVHFICKGTLPCGRRRKGNVEMYDELRYFTMTGNTPLPLPVLDCTKSIQSLHQHYLAEKKDPVNEPRILREPFLHPSPIQDMAVVEKACEGHSGAKFKMLYEGDWQSLGYPSQSEGDLAFCALLAFWCGKDREQMDRIFRQSGLYRGEWERKSKYTLTKAIDSCPNVYQLSFSDRSSQPALVSDSPPVKEKMSLTEYQQRYSVKGQLPQFLQEIVDNVDVSVLSTGFPSLDQILEGGLYEGLYILGAISSLGKTTLALQIGDSLALRGQDVLFFSLEMAKRELMAKSISRETAQMALEGEDVSQGKTTRDVMRGERWDGYSKAELKNLQDAIGRYQDYGEHLFLFEGTMGVMDVVERVEEHIRLTGTSPVVMVDYLQILTPYDMRATDKQNTDKAVLALKKLSGAYKIPVLAISSFNRENYRQGVTMASFKESGAIEYSSDVLMGLQYQGMDEKEKKGEEHSTKASEGKVLQVELKVLKNRNGGRGRLLLDYYAMFNLFRETTPTKKRKAPRGGI